MLPPQLTVLVRPSGVVQLGWHPETALLLDAGGLGTDTVVAFLRLLDGTQSKPQIVWRAGEHGIEPDRAMALLDVLDEAGLLEHPEERGGRISSVRVHGLGPMSDAIVTGLRKLGVRPSRSREYGPQAGPVSGWRDDLVVLADTMVADPRLIDDLVRYRIAHLPVRLRDGRGVIGPLVLPGATSCLRCADLLRADHDTEWPHLAAQLLDRVGHASPAKVAAIAALAVSEVEDILALSTRRPLATLDATLEVDLCARLLDRRRWPRHDECGCRRIPAGLTACRVPERAPDRAEKQ
ncbi:bacteriocin biosynthesis cyclodehydratase domain-containing protein [Nocardia tenerifensis]|uniref:Bacteriocin biosynthesis cyclodehydratase domain-containing protein n=2 Tax=Nocardia tenerifensis TaxID=228006 RepID=A0A318KC36_9NOCA|nr:bacteriocin biosynthesis cyclodehydratase domain-containing protein [Nocardia tenerifensis]